MAQSRSVDGRDGELRCAAVDGLADGFRQHFPGTVGLALKGSVCCGLASFVHFVLGVSLDHAALAGLGGGAGVGISSVIQKRRRQRAASNLLKLGEQGIAELSLVLNDEQSCGEQEEHRQEAACGKEEARAE